jgi:hypothetical protein
MLNSCRKFVWMKICYWKLEGNLNNLVRLWAQQHGWQTLFHANTICLCACRFSTKILRLLSPGCAPRKENSFFLPWSYTLKTHKLQQTAADFWQLQLSCNSLSTGCVRTACSQLVDKLSTACWLVDNLLQGARQTCYISCEWQPCTNLTK